jgi:hypothetical protein
LNINCVLIFPTPFVWNISHSKKKSVRYYHKCTWSPCKVPVILVRIFSADFRKIFNYQISWKSVQWELNCSMQMCLKIKHYTVTDVSKHSNTPRPWRWTHHIPPKRLHGVASRTTQIFINTAARISNLT